eukprot:ANDGO_04215.mRNA.1 hypothetical protein DICPUDRAFT_47060
MSDFKLDFRTVERLLVSPLSAAVQAATKAKHSIPQEYLQALQNGLNALHRFQSGETPLGIGDRLLAAIRPALPVANEPQLPSSGSLGSLTSSSAASSPSKLPSATPRHFSGIVDVTVCPHLLDLLSSMVSFGYFDRNSTVMTESEFIQTIISFFTLQQRSVLKMQDMVAAAHLHIIKACAAATASPYITVRGSDLVLIVRCLFNIQVFSADTEVSSAAFGALLNVIIHASSKVATEHVSTQSSADEVSTSSSAYSTPAKGAMDANTSKVSSSASFSSFAAAPTPYKDVLRLFRSFCGLAVTAVSDQDLVDPSCSAMRSRVLALSILEHLLDKCSNFFSHFKAQFAEEIKIYLAPAVLNNLALVRRVPVLTTLCLQILLAIASNFREHLIPELRTFLNVVYAKTIASANLSICERNLVISGLGVLCRDRDLLLSILCVEELDLPFSTRRAQDGLITQEENAKQEEIRDVVEHLVYAVRLAYDEVLKKTNPSDSSVQDISASLDKVLRLTEPIMTAKYQSAWVSQSPIKFRA